jgi:hypothetical protein
METTGAQLLTLGEINLSQKLWILTFLQEIKSYSLESASLRANKAVEEFEKKFPKKLGRMS